MPVAILKAVEPVTPDQETWLSRLHAGANPYIKPATLSSISADDFVKKLMSDRPLKIGTGDYGESMEQSRTRLLAALANPQSLHKDEIDHLDADAGVWHAALRHELNDERKKAGEIASTSEIKIYAGNVLARAAVNGGFKPSGSAYALERDPHRVGIRDAESVMNETAKQTHGSALLTLQKRLKAEGQTELPPTLHHAYTGNMMRELGRVDDLVAHNPSALVDPMAWKKFAVEVSGSRVALTPPTQFIEYFNNPSALQPVLQAITPKMVEDARAGLGLTRRMRKQYESGKATLAGTTAPLLLWTRISASAPPYNHEAAFLEMMNARDPKAPPGTPEHDGVRWFFNEAAQGRHDQQLYKDWIENYVFPEKGTAGRQFIHNCNAFGEQVLTAFGRKGHDGLSGLEWLHQALSDPNASGRSIRKDIHARAYKMGMDNKLISFFLLMSGFHDMMVMDRIQIHHAWHANHNFRHTETGEPQNIYGDISTAFNGPQGLAYYGAIEAALDKHLPRLYESNKDQMQRLGLKPEEWNTGSFHWLTWVAQGEAEVGHDTVAAIARSHRIDTHDSYLDTLSRQGRFEKPDYGHSFGVINVGGERRKAFIVSLPDENGHPDPKRRYWLDPDMYASLRAALGKNSGRKDTIQVKRSGQVETRELDRPRIHEGNTDFMNVYHDPETNEPLPWYLQGAGVKKEWRDGNWATTPGDNVNVSAIRRVIARYIKHAISAGKGGRYLTARKSIAIADFRGRLGGDAADTAATRRLIACITRLEKATSKPDRKYATTQIDAPNEIAEECRNWSKKWIKSSDLAEKGYEDHLHVTVKYGIVDEDVEAISKALQKLTTIRCSLGKVEKFTSNPDYDVIYVNVNSEDLHKANALVKDAVKCEDTFPDYKPHMTLAYVKKGSCDDLLGDGGVEFFMGRHWVSDTVTFSSKARKTTEIKL